jgi:voltage-gated potassium channel
MTGPTTTASASPGQPQARPSSRTIAWTVLRATGSVTVLIVIYYLLPLDHVSTPAAVTILITGLVGFIALVTFHVRSILRSPFPQLRAVEALAISVPLFLLLFAATYVVLATTSTSNFGGRLSHTDGLYFAVTVFSTVGFGDITAKTGTGRLVVTGQMIGDLIILGLAVKVIVGAVKRGRQQQTAPEQHPDPARPVTSGADETR